MQHTHFATVREPTHFYFAEAGTSGTGIGLNAHNRNGHLRFQDAVRRRYQRQRDEAWASHFARLSHGIALQRAGNTDDALAFYAQVMRDCPDEPNTVYLKAQAHLQAGELWAARLAFKRGAYLRGYTVEFIRLFAPNVRPEDLNRLATGEGADFSI